MSSEFFVTFFLEIGFLELKNPTSSKKVSFYTIRYKKNLRFAHSNRYFL